MSLEQIVIVATLAAGGIVLAAAHRWADVRSDVRNAVSVGVVLTYAAVLYLQPFGLVASDLALPFLALAVIGFLSLPKPS